MSAWLKSYYYYLFFADCSIENAPWIRSIWLERVELKLRELLTLSLHFADTGLRVDVMQKDGKYRKLGRLKWDQKSHDKWTIEKASDRDLEFCSFESWTPIWTKCEKNDSPPDIYIAIDNERIISQKQYEFDLFAAIAIAKDLCEPPKDLMIEIAKALNAKRAVKCERRWSKNMMEKSCGADDDFWIFNNAILDTQSWCVSKQNLHKTPFNEIPFEPFWEMIY